VVDGNGAIVNVWLNSPFAYLRELAGIAERGAAQGKGTVLEELAFANRASVVELQVLVGVSD
jgi:hypothetical protein